MADEESKVDLTIKVKDVGVAKFTDITIDESVILIDTFLSETEFINDDIVVDVDKIEAKLN